MTPIKLVATAQRVTCAWCGRRLGWKDGEGVKGTSHAICEACYGGVTGCPPQ